MHESNIYLFIYKRVLVGGNQNNCNKLSFIIHNIENDDNKNNSYNKKLLEENPI